MCPLVHSCQHWIIGLFFPTHHLSLASPSDSSSLRSRLRFQELRLPLISRHCRCFFSLRSPTPHHLTCSPQHVPLLHKTTQQWPKYKAAAAALEVAVALEVAEADSA